MIMIKIGVMGYGYWGPNLVRNFNEVDDSQVVAVSDPRPERLRVVERLYPSIKATKDHRKLLVSDKEIDAIAIATTPVSTPFGLAMEALEAVKLMKREVIEKFNLVSRSPFSEAERLIYASKAGYRITEYPVSVSPRRTGRARGVKTRFIIDSLIDVFRVWHFVNFKR
jgi:hypothetical protein